MIVKDIDGNEIYCGDVMQLVTNGRRIKVIGLGDNKVFFEDSLTAITYTTGDMLRAYKPTVEDLLVDFAEQYEKAKSDLQDCKGDRYTMAMAGLLSPKGVVSEFSHRIKGLFERCPHCGARIIEEATE